MSEVRALPVSTVLMATLVAAVGMATGIRRRRFEARPKPTSRERGRRVGTGQRVRRGGAVDRSRHHVSAIDGLLVRFWAAAAVAEPSVGEILTVSGESDSAGAIGAHERVENAMILCLVGTLYHELHQRLLSDFPGVRAEVVEGIRITRLAARGLEGRLDQAGASEVDAFVVRALALNRLLSNQL